MAHGEASGGEVLVRRNLETLPFFEGEGVRGDPQLTLPTVASGRAASGKVSVRAKDHALIAGRL